MGKKIKYHEMIKNKRLDDFDNKKKKGGEEVDSQEKSS